MSVEPLLASLSPTERRVLDILLTGAQNKEITKTLGLAEGTVRTHLKSIFKKLGARSRVEAVIKVLPRVPCSCSAAMHLEFAGPLVLRSWGQISPPTDLPVLMPVIRE